MVNPSDKRQLASPGMRERVLLVVIFTVFLDLVGFGIVIPLLPLYVKSMQASEFTVGVILASFSLAQLMATPILGRLSDRYGRRRIILFSLTGNAIAMAVFAAAAHLSLLPLLFVSRILAGATAGNLSACQAAIADVTDRKERVGAMGRLGAGIGLGLVIGPVIGGWLTDLAPWAPPVAGAVMALIDVVATFFLMPETLHARRSLAPPPPAAPVVVVDPALPSDVKDTKDAPVVKDAKPAPSSIWDVLRERRMASVLVLFFLTFLTMTNIQVALALLATERMKWGPKDIGVAFGMFGLCGLVIQGVLIGRLAKLFGELKLIIAGAAFNVAGMLCIGFARTPLPLMGGLIFIGIGIGITNPSLSSLASRFARDEQQGAVLGFAQSAGGLARTIGPLWSGFLFQHLGSTAPFMGGAIASLLALLVGMSVRESAAPESTPSP